MAFDPDAWLAENEQFDPDAWLAENEPRPDIAPDPAQQEPAVAPERPALTGGRGIAGQRAQQREFDLKEDIKAAIPAYEGDVAQLQEIGAAPELNELSMKGFKTSLAANLMGSDFELAQSLKEQMPGTTISRDEDANLIATLPSGGSYYLNAPGVSGQDVMKFLTRAGLFALGGSPTGAGLGALTKTAATAAGTEAGAQAAEAGLGGEFNKEDVAIAGAAAPVVQAAGSKIAQAFDKRAADKLLKEGVPSIDRLKSEAGKLYKQVDDMGVTVESAPLQSLSNNITSTMKREGFNARIHPKVAAAMDEISQQTGHPLTISEIGTLRKVARSAARSTEPEEARLGSMMVDKIDDFLDRAPVPEGAGQTLKQARKYWSKAKKSELIQDAIDRAELQASGFENGLRTQFRSILNNKKKMRGFSPDERAAMQTIVKGGKAENIAKALGKFGFTEGQATSMLMSSGALATGLGLGMGPAAAAIPLAGQGFKKLAQKLTRDNVKLADNLVRTGKDARKIALAYVKSTPKHKRSAEDLTALLLDKGADVKTLARHNDKLFSDAAFFTKALQRGGDIEASKGVVSAAKEELSDESVDDQDR